MSITSEVITTFANIPPIEEQSAAYKLWHHQFACRINQIHLYETAYLEQARVAYSGDKNVEKALANQSVTAMFVPAALAEFVHEGVPFQLVDPRDAANIYRIVHQHLKDWQHAASSEVNVMDGPIEDLRKFDALAGEIYPFARPYLAINPFHGTFLATLDGMSRRRGLSRHRTEKPVESVVDSLPSGHTPMADAISKPLAARRKSWR